MKIWSNLTGENDQGVLLVGERKFGKSSFLNCVIGLFPREEGNLHTIRFDHFALRYSAQTFAIEVLKKLSQSVGSGISLSLISRT